MNALNPWDRLTSVFPTFLTSKMEGALMSYQSESHAQARGRDGEESCVSDELGQRILGGGGRGEGELTLSGEGVHDLLLDALLALGESLVL